MAKQKAIKYNYSGIKFTIKERHNKWWLDFYFNKKRVRRSTECLANKDGLIEVKKVNHSRYSTIPFRSCNTSRS